MLIEALNDIERRLGGIRGVFGKAAVLAISIIMASSLASAGTSTNPDPGETYTYMAGTTSVDVSDIDNISYTVKGGGGGSGSAGDAESGSPGSAGDAVTGNANVSQNSTIDIIVGSSGSDGSGKGSTSSGGSGGSGMSAGASGVSGAECNDSTTCVANPDTTESGAGGGGGGSSGIETSSNELIVEAGGGYGGKGGDGNNFEKIQFSGGFSYQCITNTCSGGFPGFGGGSTQGGIGSAKSTTVGGGFVPGFVEVTYKGNSPPTADFSYSPSNPFTSDSISFDGSSSSDPDGDPLTYSWDWTSDSTYEGSGEMTSHTYMSPGCKGVTLKVDDGNGGTDTTTKYIAVDDNLLTSSSTAAAEGKTWMSEDSFRWSNGTHKLWLNGANIVDGSSNGPAGSLWIEGTDFHWIDTNSNERSFTGNKEGSAGGDKGSTWVEDGMIHYIDQNSDKREVDGIVEYRC